MIKYSWTIFICYDFSTLENHVIHINHTHFIEINNNNNTVATCNYTYFINTKLNLKKINMVYLLKMEYVSKINIFGLKLKMMLKSGLYNNDLFA
jgi:hypothetical protein